MHRIWIGGLMALAAASSGHAAEPRHLTPDDIFNERAVSSPALSPDGAWVAYAVKALDKAQDKGVTHLWMTSFDGKQTVQLTSAPKESENTPRWSPDGRYLAFISGRRDDDEADQLWLLDRLGGEAQKITSGKRSVEDFAWSPDGKSIALILRDAPPEPPKAADGEKADPKRPQPIVIDRFQFKQDIAGYLGVQRGRLYVMSLADKTPVRITTGEFEEALPAWSPDGRSIAFVSNRGKDIDRDYNTDLYVVEAKAGGALRAVTTYAGADNDPEWNSYPAWSPDGKSIAYLQGGEIRKIGYGVHTLAVVPAAGGAPRVLTPTLDRNVYQPRWSADGKTLTVTVEDDQIRRLVAIPAAGGAPKDLLAGRQQLRDYDTDGKGKLVGLISDPTHPAEVYAIAKGQPRALSHQNDWLKSVALASTEEIKFKDPDGVEIHGFLVKPPGYVAGKRYPTILRLHGGPQSQYELAWNQEWQMLAAQGYVVVASNPRGSNGRGEAFGMALYADWGTPAVKDVLAGVDYAVAQGIADPARLGVGGWSYGGILTNYVIASDTRFRAATSGASISNVLAGYGTDQYIRDYEMELGRPWEHPEAWMKISYPFYHADQIKTPTLFLGGDKDFNVPLLNTEQMYQALRSLGVETQMVIYPGQFHGLTRPSFLKDRLDRYIAWYGDHLK
ncbi:alpha/beta hydrolase family protein [Phenylobacterium aquaticum]|uniref:S9 family peptidase n=1 Tax=Phenylobacterium aquaticum TaxID=1763816 RepID=UPI001F5DC72E|nr:S9 family peptidase [Phenylobacterium aquaticum]MCI3131537.1 S9 family peptidase [Phenylobacterium aquaticum]